MRYLIFPVFFFIFLCSASFAQIYKYTDKDGVVRYTNDPASVPENQRNDVKKYEEIKSPKTDTGEVKKKNKQKTKAKTQKASKQSAPSKAESQGIAKQKQELEKEYTALKKEKEQIARDKATYSKRYKTRARKSVSRKKLMALEQQEKEWEKKFSDYKAKKKALDMLKQKGSGDQGFKDSSGTK